MPKNLRGKAARVAGNTYELKIVKELKTLTGNENIATSRANSKALDNNKVDIFDPDNILPFYVQCKCSQSRPSTDIIKEFKLTDKPLAIFWKHRIKKESKCVSGGEYVTLEKEAFYNLLKNFICVK